MPLTSEREGCRQQPRGKWMTEEWTNQELAAAVDAYAAMAQAATSGKLNKKAVYRDLASRFGRTEGAYEYRMQNISWVLADRNREWLPGLPPAKNIGKNVAPRLIALVERRFAAPKAVQARYIALLPRLREHLIQVARACRTVTYGDLMATFELDRFSLRHAMDRLGHEALDRGEPIITALIVGKESRRCSSGLAKEFGILDDDGERQRLYAHWRNVKQRNRQQASAASVGERARRFAMVAVRPDQAKFREAVFLAFDGRCAITECNLDCALDAAHRHGRDWRMGHNKADDGLLLRKDLHALYDRGLMWIEPDGVVRFAGEALRQYKALDGRVLSVGH
jgi:hypothetical protein